MKPNILLSFLVILVFGTAMAIEFRDNAASYVKPKYDVEGKLSHIQFEPLKMVKDNKNIDETELKQNGLEIKTGYEENYTTFNKIPKVIHGRYQYTISCAEPRQQVRGRRRCSPTEVVCHQQ